MQNFVIQSFNSLRGTWYDIDTFNTLDEAICHKDGFAKMMKEGPQTPAFVPYFEMLKSVAIANNFTLKSRIVMRTYTDTIVDEETIDLQGS